MSSSINRISKFHAARVHTISQPVCFHIALPDVLFIAINQYMAGGLLPRCTGVRACTLEHDLERWSVSVSSSSSAVAVTGCCSCDVCVRDWLEAGGITRAKEQ